MLSDLGSERNRLEDPGLGALLALFRPLVWACWAVGSHRGVVMFLEVFCPTSEGVCLSVHVPHFTTVSFPPTSPKTMFSASYLLFLGPTLFSSILSDLIWGAPQSNLLSWQVHNCPAPNWAGNSCPKSRLHPLVRQEAAEALCTGLGNLDFVSCRLASSGQWSCVIPVIQWCEGQRMARSAGICHHQSPHSYDLGRSLWLWDLSHQGELDFKCFCEADCLK